jgi:hypothetical protein
MWGRGPALNKHKIKKKKKKKKIIELFTPQKIVIRLSKLWVCDPDLLSGIRKKPYSGSRILVSKRHRIPDPESVSATLCLLYTIILPSTFLNTKAKGYWTCVVY